MYLEVTHAKSWRLYLNFNHFCTFILLQYNELQLYNQLSFYQYIFNAQKALSLLDPKEKGRSFLVIPGYVTETNSHGSRFVDKVKGEFCHSVAGPYEKLREHVGQVLKQSAYSQVDLNELFNFQILKIKSEK